MLVATRTPDELDAATLTAADVWGFGCSVLKIFLSHSGPHTQKQVCMYVHTQVNSLFCDDCLKTCPSGRCGTYLHVLSCGKVLSVSSGPAIDSIADVIPPPLAQGRVPLGEGGRQGKGGTQGMQEYI